MRTGDLDRVPGGRAERAIDEHGGHIVGALYEAVRRRLAALFRRPDPGFVDTAKMLPVAYVVGSLIAVSGAVLILADVIDPIRLF